MRKKKLAWTQIFEREEVSKRINKPEEKSKEKKIVERKGNKTSRDNTFGVCVCVCVYLETKKKKKKSKCFKENKVRNVDYRNPREKDEGTKKVKINNNEEKI